ncbi:MAG: glycosyltransferase family 4 protein [Pseudomonadales bacterium]|nr:glycosyltransferase family 4 protein [Pseudomonadales bacterium]
MAGKRRAVVAHYFWGRGGAEIAAMWIIRSLIEAGYEIHILTAGGFSLEELEQAASVKLARDSLVVHAFEKLNLPLSGALNHGLFLRWVRGHASDYDLRITPSGVIDWGAPAIHFISSVIWNRTLRSQFLPSSVKLKSQQRVTAWVSGRSTYDGSSDLYIANSVWTMKVSQPFCPGPMKVIAPPVLVPESELLSERSTDFLYVGRIEQEKKVDQSIEMIRAVRARGFDIRLHLIGELGADAYGEKIRDLADRYREFVVVHGRLLGAEKWQVISQCQFGINACEIEAFGMSSAELAKSGPIVFVPGKGAQSEIVPLKELVWNSFDDAVDKISRVLAEPSSWPGLSEQLKQHNRHLSCENFVSSVRETILEFEA